MPEDVSAVRQSIRALLRDQHGGDRFVDSVSDSESLRQAGMSSNALVALLVAMEDEFDFEWDDDVHPEVLRSIGSLADHVVALRA
ncbi:phosphopantetheine-binding protein [Streptomyces sp. NRRL F-5123]|uniref:phosphopantetheine-binding protein n=1 Tax=Streptomyces sp. NRRL F-5123 TaxID=1463856 RepID=UPI0004E1C547|nr:phosphopantetheine-binding protein [Streptomyces sp. NRRL F-5123]